MWEKHRLILGGKATVLYLSIIIQAIITYSGIMAGRTIRR